LNFPQVLFTIGVYGYDRESFFEALALARIDLLVDVRRRRAVRGSRYAFANAKRLVACLGEMGIAYRHVLELAPDNETREVIYAADRAAHRRGSERTELTPEYLAQYRSRTLDRFDFKSLARELEAYRAPALLCVEGEPNACHRSLVAEKLIAASRISAVTHLRAAA
jgi:uncharacterized protein (DUF488 family)